METVLVPGVDEPVLGAVRAALRAAGLDLASSPAVYSSLWRKAAIQEAVAGLSEAPILRPEATPARRGAGAA